MPLSMSADVGTPHAFEHAAVKNRIDRLARAPERGRGRNSRTSGAAPPRAEDRDDLMVEESVTTKDGGTVTRLVPLSKSRAYELGKVSGLRQARGIDNSRDN